jgi:hypothetical protein
MRNLTQTLVNGAVILFVSILAALLMHLVTPSGGLLGIALWAIFFVTLLYFPPKECASKLKALWKRG